MRRTILDYYWICKTLTKWLHFFLTLNIQTCRQSMLETVWWFTQQASLGPRHQQKGNHLRLVISPMCWHRKGISVDRFPGGEWCWWSRDWGVAACVGKVLENMGRERTIDPCHLDCWWIQSEPTHKPDKNQLLCTKLSLQAAGALEVLMNRVLRILRKGSRADGRGGIYS